MLRQLFKNRRVVWLLAVRNVQDRYTGTFGGMIWAILHPILLLLVFWFVFGVGLRMQSGSGAPFVLSLFCGLIPWMTFNESLSSAASSITGRAYLVKKIAFPMEVLPFTHLLASLFTHGVLLIILALMLAAYRVVPGPGIVLLPYYIFSMCALAAGLALLLAAASVFYRDILQGLGVALNIWFWATPIVWPADMLSPTLRHLLNLNPLNYVISGYRSSLLAQEFIAPTAVVTAYFWVVVLALWIAGAALFNRLKPAFADVL